MDDSSPSESMMCPWKLHGSLPKVTVYVFYAFYVRWLYFLQLGALAEGTPRPVTESEEVSPEEVLGWSSSFMG
jgi:hypothetical protein